MRAITNSRRKLRTAYQNPNVQKNMTTGCTVLLDNMEIPMNNYLPYIPQMDDAKFAILDDNHKNRKISTFKLP